MNEKSKADEKCKICFRGINPSNCATLEDKLEFFETVLIKLVFKSSISYHICSDCVEKINSAFNFKCLSIRTEDSVVQYFDPSRQIDLKRVICEKDNYRIPMRLEHFEVCRLCKTFVVCDSVVPLRQILEDASIAQIFENHIPEINLGATLNPHVCERCQECLINFAKLLFLLRDQNFLKTEHDRVPENRQSIAKGIKHKTVKIKPENDERGNAEYNIKKENEVEIIEMEDLELKYDEMDCSINRDDNTSSVVPVNPKQIQHNGEQIATEPKLIKQQQYPCYKCSVKCISLQKLIEHYRIHGQQKVVRNCLICGFSTTDLGVLQKHKSTHKKLSVMKKTSCPKCPFVTSDRRAFWTHLISHLHFKKTPDGDRSTKKITVTIEMAPNINPLFKCDSCEFQTTHHHLILKHTKGHTDQKEKPIIRVYQRKKPRIADTFSKAFHEIEESVKTTGPPKSYIQIARKTFSACSGVEEVIHFCELCEYRSLCLDDLKSHIEVHV